MIAFGNGLLFQIIYQRNKYHIHYGYHMIGDSVLNFPRLDVLQKKLLFIP
jgi:hypothetical protein